MSCSGFKYIMNIVDDYSGYNWTHLLKAKSNALPAFRSWQVTVENQTDNGELHLMEMANWCADWGVTHLFTALHMSGVVSTNGCIKRLH